ncbi:hypothetical protein LXM94_16495 [Rhizobium sp. TRM95111]|uniref:hypothetical protein n=1 Tax=Rhizobium alarense TaxID=2846851 RepID=UPI001F1E7128|nr:hypothetical protein [Rhizobium alarense]MCF3641573.1 hypothetical protein [Rhizobium alarense]
MAVNLAKIVEPGSLRWIGQRLEGLAGLDIPVGASDMRAVALHLGGEIYRIGGINLRNAFVVERGPLRLVYVRPTYSGYRFAARRVFKSTPWAVDYDHVLARNIAIRFGVGYVLLIRLPPRANRSHGPHEKPALRRGVNLRKLLFADRRILDKWLGRPVRPLPDMSRCRPYSPQAPQAFALTLKQLGAWGFAMGMEDGPLPPGVLRPL